MNLPAPRAHPLSSGTEHLPVLVLVHGLEDDWRAWSEVARQLTGWRVVSLDMPWRAGNDYRWRWSGSPADWLAVALDGLGEPCPVVVGHSFGANAVLELLAGRAEPPCSVAVLSMPFYRRADATVTWRTVARSRQTFERQIRGGMRARLSRRAGALHREVLEAMFAKAVERIGPVGFLAVFEQYVASGHLPLADVPVPTLILGGERDAGLSMRDLRVLTGALPRGRLRCEPNFDHFCHLGHAGQLATIIDEFAAEFVTESTSWRGGIELGCQPGRGT